MDDVQLDNGWRNGGAHIDSSFDPEAGGQSSTFDVEGGQPSSRDASAQHVGLLSKNEELRIWTKRARWFTGMSMIVDFVTALLALVTGGIINSAALVGYGLEALVDLGASCLVLWRFWESEDTEEGLRRNADREERANVVIAFIFIIIAIITCGDAIEHLVQHKEPENGFLILAFAIVTMLLLGAIGCIKMYINSFIHSKALEQDAMASFATAAISVGLFISAVAYAASDRIWWLDSAVAIVVTIALALYSIPILIQRRWWHKTFWKTVREEQS